MDAQELRQRGYKVAISHFRYLDIPTIGERLAPQYVIDNLKLRAVMRGKGGLTTVVVTDPAGNVYEGSATCNKKDNFDHKVGVSMALERAIANGMTKRYVQDIMMDMITSLAGVEG